jgi:hypothetical protein
VSVPNGQVLPVNEDTSCWACHQRRRGVAYCQDCGYVWEQCGCHTCPQQPQPAPEVLP